MVDEMAKVWTFNRHTSKQKSLRRGSTIDGARATCRMIARAPGLLLGQRLRVVSQASFDFGIRLQPISIRRPMFSCATGR
jgi:hypothetical protein